MTGENLSGLPLFRGLSEEECRAVLGCIGGRESARRYTAVPIVEKESQSRTC